jgi:hypothetical protein
MHKCEVTLLVKQAYRRGRPKLGTSKIRACGATAVLQSPPGFFDDGRQVWFCRLHAPMKLLHTGDVTAKG